MNRGAMVDTSSRQTTAASTDSRLVAAVALPLIIAYVALFAYAMHKSTYDVWGALWLAPVLVIISIPILLRIARTEPDARIGKILVVALILKLAASVPRYYMVTAVYGYGDSVGYSGTGERLRSAFLQGDFSFTGLGVESRTGTQFIEIVTGIIYTLIGPSFIGGFLFFSWLSFWGLFFFYRAFRTGVPDGNARRYAVLLFLLPSMLFWPSSIGKEAWMTLVLGITTYGSAKLLARQRGATIYLVLGIAGVLMVRPHMALIVIAGIALAYVLRSNSAARAVALGKTRTAIGIAFIGVSTLLVIRRVSEFFGIDEFNLDTATETLEYAEGQTGQGGSAFVGGGPSLRNLPMNFVTVLFRPFPFEVDSIPTILAALEGTALMVLVITSLPRLRTVPRRLRKQPYIAYCLTYTILFCFMFSSFQNFGILARQRVLVFPLLLVFLALPFIDSGKKVVTRKPKKVSHHEGYVTPTRR